MNFKNIIILNKPVGITSNAIIKKLSILKKKIGYCGNLDIIATGILPIYFNNNTNFLKFINNTNKHYISIIKFGYRSDTGDINGKIISSNIKKINIKKNIFLYNIYKIQGLSYQKPHIYSSVKYKGKNLYEYTRYGIELKKKKKYIYLNKVKIIKIKKNIILKISCTKGTYIRSIIDFIGQKFKYKSYIILLHRINIGIFNIKKSIKLEDLLYIRYKNLLKLKIINNIH